MVPRIHRGEKIGTEFCVPQNSHPKHPSGGHKNFVSGKINLTEVIPRHLGTAGVFILCLEGKLAGLQKCPKDSRASNCKGQRKQPTAAQSHPSKRPWDCSELPQLEPLCSLAKTRGKASCTDRPSSAGLGSLSQCESGTHMWAPSPALPPFWAWNTAKREGETRTSPDCRKRV